MATEPRERLRRVTTRPKSKAAQAREDEYRAAVEDRGAVLLSSGYNASSGQYHATCEAGTDALGKVRPTIERGSHQELLHVLSSKTLFRGEVERIVLGRKSYDLDVDLHLARFRNEVRDASTVYGTWLSAMLCTGGPAPTTLPGRVVEAQAKAQASYAAYREALRLLDEFKATLGN